MTSLITSQLLGIYRIFFEDCCLKIDPSKNTFQKNFYEIAPSKNTFQNFSLKTSCISFHNFFLLRENFLNINEKEESFLYLLL